VRSYQRLGSQLHFCLALFHLIGRRRVRHRARRGATGGEHSVVGEGREVEGLCFRVMCTVRLTKEMLTVGRTCMTE
jgi:hypothetical protein